MIKPIIIVLYGSEIWGLSEVLRNGNNKINSQNFTKGKIEKPRRFPNSNIKRPLDLIILMAIMLAFCINTSIEIEQNNILAL